MVHTTPTLGLAVAILALAAGTTHARPHGNPHTSRAGDKAATQGLSGCPASCPQGLSVGSACANSLAAAVASAKAGDTIYVHRNIDADREISVGQKSLTFSGCGGAKPTVSLTADLPQGGIFRVTSQHHQSLSFANIDFARASGYGSFLRTPEIGDGEFPGDVDYEATDLHISGCKFSKFKTQARGGGAIFIGRTGTVSISGSVFEESVATRHPNHKLRWESGGGAVWIREASGSITIDGTTFRRNMHEFEHGNGGALCIENVFEGASVTFGPGTAFLHNHAPGGGALYIGSMEGTLTTQATFERNENSQGWGTRGGAMWIQNTEGGTMQIGGKFIGNRAMIDSAETGNGKGRGGAIATNIIRNSKVDVTAEFADNESLGGGSVWDGLSGGGALRGSTLTFQGSTFKGNKAGSRLALRINRASTGVISLTEARLQGHTVTLR